jgi:tyrosyl-tRNA synthetase
MWQYYELLTREDLNAAKALHPMEAKKRLASLIVGQYHGEAEGRRAREEFEKVFTKKDTPDDIEEYRAAPGKISISHLLFEAGLSPSKKESRRLIEQGGVRIDGQQVQSDADVQTGQPFILQVGKRKFKRIVFQ